MKLRYKLLIFFVSCVVIGFIVSLLGIYTESVQADLGAVDFVVFCLILLQHLRYITREEQKD